MKKLLALASLIFVSIAVLAIPIANAAAKIRFRGFRNRRSEVWVFFSYPQASLDSFFYLF